MIETVIAQFERGAAELDDAALVAHGFVRQHGVRVFECGEACLGALMGDHFCARVLERLATGNMVKVVVTIDQILDRLVGDFANLVEIGLPAGGPAIGHRVGGDHAR